MKTTTFLKKKNKIVKKVTGVTLIPKNQIVKTPKVFLSYKSLNTYNGLAAQICPYCELYNNEQSISNDCFNCPMSKKGNNCVTNNNSTWRIANNIWLRKATKNDKEELQKLADKYNSEI